MSKVKEMDFCPEHLVSFSKGQSCHVCGKTMAQQLGLGEKRKRKPITKKDPDEETLTWRELLYKLQDMDEEGVDLDGTVMLTDGGDSFGKELVNDSKKGLLIIGF